MGELDPAAYGFVDGESFETVWVPTRDGLRLHAWLFKVPAQSAAAVPTVLFLHSNAGTISHRLPNIRGLLERAGVNVFIVDYRGYGRSEGTPSEAGLRIDAEDALSWLRAREDIDPRRIVVFGRSLGGAVAVHLASARPLDVACLVLENTFTSVPDLVPALLPLLAPVRHLSRNRWDSLATIATLRLPILFLSALADEMVPPAQMRALAAAAGKSSPSITIIPFASGHHMDLPDQPGYYEKFRDWVFTHAGQ
jgi:fermentation-respiration switch protein FrsA (DUF1100 family)